MHIAQWHVVTGETLNIISHTNLFQLLLLLLLIAKDKNDGEKQLFRCQQWKAVDIIAITIILNLLLSFYVICFNHSLFPSLDYDYFYLGEFILIILIFKIRIKQDFVALGFKVDSWVKIASISIFAALFNFVLIYIIFFLLNRPKSFNLFTINEITSLKSTVEYVKYFFVAIIFAPLVEETIYRGILYSPYRKKYGPQVAIVITSLFFSAGHFGVGILSTFIGGLIFGILYEKTESIYSPIIAHSLFNLFNILTVLIFLT